MSSTISHGHFRRARKATVLVAVAATALLGGTLVAGSAGAAPQPSGAAGKFSVVSTPTGTTLTGAKSFTGRLAKSDPNVLKLTGTKPVSVMVKLDYDALGSYSGDLTGFPATSPRVTGHPLNVDSAAALAYTGHIKSIENGFLSGLHAAIPSAVVGTAYRTLYGGLTLRVPSDQVSRLLSLPGVAAVQADSLHKLEQATPVNDGDVSFIGANAAYGALGSSATAGKGVIVADVDTGVWPEHPSFAARPDLPATPPPTPNGHPRACNFGTNPLTSIAFSCNNKLIEGQVFLDTYNSILGDELYKTTARDSNGHGTHTTSTAAGNPLANAVLFGVDRGPIQGVAPGAFVMSYKALGPQGGFDSDLVAAIEQAVLDGANVINYSIGPSTPQSAYTSADDLAFLDAYDAGVFVSASAGNSGPGAQTVSHNGPWETTVGASTLQRAFESTATIVAPGGTPTLTITGDSIMPGISSATPVVNASSVSGYSSLCNTPAAPGSFTGEIVVCVRGGNGRVEKGFNVHAGGAAGMFLINPVVEDTETDNHFLSAVHFDAPAGNQLESFLAAHPGSTATFTTGQKAVGQGDVMAAFSSRGPGGDGFLKPDITAPGVQILAGNTPTPTDVASGPTGQLFQAIAGTSMAAPHITGSAALVLALHPGFSPAQVKSVLMMTANRNVVEQDGITPAGVFDDGAGRVDLNGVVDPGLTLDVTPAQMDLVLTDPLHRIDLNEPSVYDASLPGRVTTTRQFKNIDAHPEVYKITATSDLPGGITVSPSIVTVPPGSTVPVSITLDGTGGTVGNFYTGQIDLTQISGPHHLHLPVAFSPSDASVAPAVTVSSACNPATIKLAVQATTCTATVQNNALQPAATTAAMSWTNNLQFLSAGPGGTLSGRSVKFGPVNLAAAQPPSPVVASGTSPAGFVDLSLFTTIQSMGDETITNFNTPSFAYDGVSYSRLGVVSDGYLVVGGGDTSDISSSPQTMPNPVRPNNVLAPLWTDLDGGAGTIVGQGMYIVALTDGVHSWIVVQWNTHVFGTSTIEKFQAWIGFGGTQDISYTYDTVSNPGVAFNVGAENADGTRGSNVSGVPSGDLVVISAPGVAGGSATFSTTLRGVIPGSGTVETDVNSSVSRDTSVSKAPVTITK